MKILCSAAAEMFSFERCLEIGKAVNSQTVSIGSALDHCHVPGRQHQSIPDDVCVVGAGIHNEPGQQMISPAPTVESLVERCLQLLCDSSDPERGFVDFSNSQDKIALLVNNYGGLSVLELGALADEVNQQLKLRYEIVPSRTLIGAFETSLNAPGFSISLCNISAAARQAHSTDVELLRLFDRPTSAASWPNTTTLTTVGSEKQHTNGINGHKLDQLGDYSTSNDVHVDPLVLEAAIRTSCQNAIAAEPQLTKWDMVMGDGDCGEAVKGLCEHVLRNLDNGVASTGSLIFFLSSMVEAVDDMGGTLGAIFGILLSAFSSALQEASKEGQMSTRLYSSALARAVESLKSYTPAREGDRTVMDVLLPFSEAFTKSQSLEHAVQVAAEKAEATRFLKARFGRATYVGEASGQELPDPGAWALYEIVAGMASGMASV
jgi:dihydroxyacetone kinase